MYKIIDGNGTETPGTDDEPWNLIDDAVHTTGYAALWRHDAQRGWVRTSTHINPGWMGYTVSQLMATINTM